MNTKNIHITEWFEDIYFYVHFCFTYTKLKTNDFCCVVKSLVMRDGELEKHECGTRMGNTLYVGMMTLHKYEVYYVLYSVGIRIHEPFRFDNC